MTIVLKTACVYLFTDLKTGESLEVGKILHFSKIMYRNLKPPSEAKKYQNNWSQILSLK